MPPALKKNDAREWFASYDFTRTIKLGASRRWTRILPALARRMRSSTGWQREEGTWHWVRARGLCVRDADGQRLRVAGSVSDIDAQRRAEDQLRESEERYVIAIQVRRKAIGSGIRHR